MSARFAGLFVHYIEVQHGTAKKRLRTSIRKSLDLVCMPFPVKVGKIVFLGEERGLY